MVRIDGAKVKQTRERKGLTQLYVATVVEVTTDTISRWENRRYPSIKRENGLKLARALGVELEDFLEQREQGEVEQTFKKPVQIPARKRFFAGILLFIMLTAVVAGWILYRQKNGELSFAARRIMPVHVPAGAVFPVIINVKVDSAGSFPLIVKEILPEGCIAVQGVPAFRLTGGNRRILKWVTRITGGLDIIYLVRTDSALDTELLTGFSGKVTVGKKAVAREISGDASIFLAPYHWIDQNRDNVIDDEEILSFYDLFSEVRSLAIKRDQIDDIWAGNGYVWNEQTKQYELMPEKPKERK